MEFRDIYEAVVMEGTEVFHGAVGIMQDWDTKKIMVQYDTEDGTVELAFERFEAAFAVFCSMTESGTTVRVITKEA